MQTFELILLGLTYTVLSIALFLCILCYKRRIENIETILFIVSLLILIISVSLSPLFETEPPSETSSISTLLSMILVGGATFFNVLGERKHKLKSWHINIYITITVILAILTSVMVFTGGLRQTQPVVVAFLIASILGGMILLKVSEPKRRFAHQAKMDNIFAITFAILVPFYLVLHYGFEEQYNKLRIGFLLPIAFSLLGINKIYDDLKRLSLLKPEANPQKQHFINYGLTEREQEVAMLLIEGKTYQHISEQLYVSLPTVKTHAGNIYKKCQVKSRHQLTSLINH